jgi:hypothetical protein
MSKPKLILHIGHSKTGTTSLQNYFYRYSSDLLRSGYLYPTRKSVRNNHILLPAGFVKDAGFRLPNNLTYRDDFERYERDFQRFWNSLLEDVKINDPGTVILSCEWFFRDFSEISRVSLSEFLGEYFSSVTVVAYIRSPVADYLSRLAQSIRTANPIPTPHARQIRAVIEYYQGQFPGCVQVHPFDRQQLRGGDILHDFCSRYVPQVLPDIERRSLKSFNTSLPWPLLRGLRRLRELAQGNTGLCSYSTRARIDWAAEDYLRLHPGERRHDVCLQAGVEAFIRHSAVDYLWLKEQFGVEFPDLDYAQIESMHNPYEAGFALERIVDFSKCPEVAFPLERYLGNGPRLWMNCLALYLRVQSHRIFRMYLSDLWLLHKARVMLQRFKES